MNDAWERRVVKVGLIFRFPCGKSKNHAQGVVACNWILFLLLLVLIWKFEFQKSRWKSQVIVTSRLSIVINLQHTDEGYKNFPLSHYVTFCEILLFFMEAIVFAYRIYIRRGRIWWAVYDSESILSYCCNASTCARESAINTRFIRI